MGENSGEILQTSVLLDRSGIVIEADKRGMVCYFSYTPSTAMPKLTLPVVKAALTKAGVKFGIINEELEKLEGREEEIKNLVIARGEKASAEAEPRLEYLFSTNPYAEFKKGKGDTQVDYRDRGKLPYVKAGETVAQIVLDQTGKPGTSILGEEVLSEYREQGEFRPGKNVKLEDTLMVAEIDGAPRLDGNGNVEVSPEWIVNGDVDIKTGNIVYPGKVRINGGIEPGYEVQAETVYCSGIENRTIVKAERNIIVDGGIQGGEIYAGGRIEARFINNAKVTAVGDIDIKLSIINADVKCSGELEAQTIFGGTVAAKKGVHCVNLSSDANRSTVIFGIDPIKQENISQIVREKIEIEEHIGIIKEKMGDDYEFHENYKKLRTEVGNLIPERDALKQRRDATDPNNESALEFFDMRLEELGAQIDPFEKEIEEGKSRFAKIERDFMNELMEINKLNKRLAKLEEEHSEIKETEEQRTGVAPKVTVKGKALQGTRISSSHARMVLRKEFSRVVFAQRLITDAEKAKSTRQKYFLSIERL